VPANCVPIVCSAFSGVCRLIATERRAFYWSDTMTLTLDKYNSCIFLREKP